MRIWYDDFIGWNLDNIASGGDMRTSRLSTATYVLFVCIFATLASAAEPEENARACFIATDECYELPFSEAFRQAFNKTGDERKSVRDPFTGDSFFWNRLTNLMYFNPANERIRKERGIILQSGMLLTCKNAEMLHHMFVTGKGDNARRSINAAFEKFKLQLLKFNNESYDEDKDTTEDILGRKLIEPVEQYVHEAYESCKERGWDTKPYRLNRAQSKI